MSNDYHEVKINTKKYQTSLLSEEIFFRNRRITKKYSLNNTFLEASGGTITSGASLGRFKSVIGANGSGLAGTPYPGLNSICLALGTKRTGPCSGRFKSSMGFKTGGGLGFGTP